MFRRLTVALATVALGLSASTGWAIGWTTLDPFNGASGDPLATPNWTRQRKIMLVAMLWSRQTAAALTPGCSASITIASFLASVKRRRFDRPSRV